MKAHLMVLKVYELMLSFDRIMYILLRSFKCEMLGMHPCRPVFTISQKENGV